MLGFEKLLLAAVFGQVLLTFIVLIVLGHRRLPLVFADKIKIADIAVSGDAWPEGAQLASNNLANQFQLPVLFYALSGLALAIDHVSVWLVILAVLFVISRYIHAFVHMTSNRVYRRFVVYLSGMVILGLMWLGFALETLFL